MNHIKGKYDIVLFHKASRNDQHTLSVMLTEAEGRVQLTTGSPAERNVTNEAIKTLLTTTEPCSGNTALHWASKHGVASCLIIFSA